jgi:hypothetical protein
VEVVVVVVEVEEAEVVARRRGRESRPHECEGNRDAERLKRGRGGQKRRKTPCPRRGGIILFGLIANMQTGNQDTSKASLG